jgi:SAM-dependent methyltransferase
MSQSELNEHRRYLTDARKSAAYRAALAEVVGEGDRVLDLGAGTGLLGHFAAEAGAREVIAVDRGDILGLAREIAGRSPHRDRIRHVQAQSTELVLDDPVDVVVCDQIGGLVHDAGILNFYADARRRLTAPGATLVPGSFRIFLAPLTFDSGRRTVDFWTSLPASIDVSAARARAVNTEWHYDIDTRELSQLAPPQQVASFAADHEGPIRGSVEFEVAHGGRFDGLLGWFEAQLSPSVTLTNDPWSPDRFDRWCNYYPVDLAAEGVDVRPGDVIAAELDVRPRLGLVAWTTEHRRDGSNLGRVRQSTLDSRFLTADSLDGLVRDAPVQRTAGLGLVRDVLDLVDGRRTERDIVAALEGRVGDEVASREHLEGLVSRVVGLGGRTVQR